MEEAKQRIKQLCSKKRTRATGSQADWQEAQTLCTQHQVKLCKTCNNVHPFAKFHSDSTGFCGRRDCCSTCYCARQTELRQGAGRVQNDTIFKRVSEAIASTGRKSSDYETEAWSCGLLELVPGIEVRFWQDGTASDAGVRPLGDANDAWLPVQMKATRAKQPPFVFNACSKYDASVVLIGVIGSGEFMVLRKSDATKNGQIKKSHRNDVISSCELSEALLEAHNSQRVANTLATELELRIQCSDSSRIEFELMNLSSRLVDHNGIKYPSVRNSSVDRILDDGQCVQDKAAAWFGSQYTFKGRLCKKFLSGVIPYFSTDCDLFVFSTLHVGMAVLFEWRIPSSWLTERGYLTVIDDDDKIVQVGKATYISLGIDDDLQLQVFGSATRSSVCTATQRFFKAYPLPQELIERIPMCLRGRDPVRV
jgi:hypothetical protein